MLSEVEIRTVGVAYRLDGPEGCLHFHVDVPLRVMRYLTLLEHSKVHLLRIDPDLVVELPLAHEEISHDLVGGELRLHDFGGAHLFELPPNLHDQLPIRYAIESVVIRRD